MYNNTHISANANGPRNAASRKINHIALPTKYNYQAKSDIGAISSSPSSTTLLISVNGVL